MGLAEEIRTWMFEAALPLWAKAGVDCTHGGFEEALDFTGRSAGVAFKRTRVAARQVYVFSHAAMLGWREGDVLAAMGCEYLTTKAWRGPDKGFARRLIREGGVLDPTPDLYDHAFALFAFAWRLRAAREAEALAWAHRTLDFIETHLTADVGYWHERPPAGPRLQNPHMHLLEAALVALEASGEARFRELALKLMGLFQAYFFDGRTLAEYFTADLARAPGDQGRIVEPGHHFEWAWILAQASRLLHADFSGEIAALVDFAEAHGVDPARQSTFNAVRDDGAPLDKGSRAWPNTERIKAWLARFEVAGADPRAAVEGSARLLLDKYLATDPPGLWIDAFDASGAPLAKTVPASTLYHLFLAFAELLRLQPRLDALA